MNEFLWVLLALWLIRTAIRENSEREALLLELTRLKADSHPPVDLRPAVVEIVREEIVREETDWDRKWAARFEELNARLPERAPEPEVTRVFPGHVSPKIPDSSSKA